MTASQWKCRGLRESPDGSSGGCGSLQVAKEYGRTRSRTLSSVVSPLSLFYFPFPVDFIIPNLNFDVPALSEEIAKEFLATLVKTLSERKEKGLAKGGISARSRCQC